MLKFRVEVWLAGFRQPHYVWRWVDTAEEAVAAGVRWAAKAHPGKEVLAASAQTWQES